ncbi:MAG: hypothetical protein U0990_09985 [Candidatus Nanopelagicales bacterium]|nr:hypothetical protein [Candidatus Nanopelagicales bacterium]
MPDKLAIYIMEQCHDFLQEWADGMKMDKDSYERGHVLRMQIDLWLGYCPFLEPEKRRP